MITTRVFLIKFGYVHAWGDDKVAEEARKLAERREMLAKYKIPCDLNDEDCKNAPTFLVTGDQVLEMMKGGADFEIKNELGIEGDNMSDTMARFAALVNKFEKLAETSHDKSFNDKCEVHVPGAALMMVNRTLLMEDACSDALQTALDEGWRIIAACPQPDSRRPDYILGRYEPDWNNGEPRNGARRKL